MDIDVVIFAKNQLNLKKTDLFHVSISPNHETRVETRRTEQLTFEDEKQIKKRRKRHSETCGSKFSFRVKLPRVTTGQ